jgi:hypothetical protein
MDNEKIIQKLMEDEDFKKIVLSRLAERSSTASSIIIDENYVDRLLSLAKEYQRDVDFKAGDLVKWKQGLKNRKKPEYNQPAIVIEILDNPVVSEEGSSGSPYFKELLTIVLGVMTENNEFSTYYFDKKRFDHFK